MNKCLYFRVNKSSNISMYKICDVTVCGGSNSLFRVGKRTWSGRLSGSCHKRH